MKKIKKCIIIAVLLLITGSVVLFDHTLEIGDFMGLSVISEQEVSMLCETKEFDENLLNSSILSVSGVSIPYAKEKNTFYISQDVGKSRFEGEVESSSEVTPYILEDEFLYNKGKAIEDNHVFCLYVISDSKYASANVVFTGLPLISINSDESVTSDYSTGTLSSYDPCNEAFLTGGGVRNDLCEVKISQSLETYTIKLRDAYGKKATDSILGLGGYSKWKIYKISGDDTYIRMMLSYNIWNQITDEKNSIPCRLAELVIDNEYMGICVFTPKMDEDALKARTVIQTEDMLEDGEDVLKIYKEYVPTNLIQYGIFLQATYAYLNLYDDVLITLRDVNDFVPGKVEYSFGIYPNRYLWMTYHNAYRVITANDLGIDDDSLAQTFDDKLAMEWYEERNDILSTENLQSDIEKMASEVRQSGVLKRLEIDDESYGDAVNKLVSYIDERYTYIDSFMEEKSMVSATELPEEGFLPIGIKFCDESQEFVIKLYHNGDMVYAFLPSFADLKDLYWTFDNEEYSLTLNGEDVESGSQVLAEAGNTYKLNVLETITGELSSLLSDANFEIYQSQDMNTVFLDTANSTMEYVNANKRNKELAWMTLIDKDGAEMLAGSELEIKGRGNSTWSENNPKRQYRMDFSAPAEILGMDRATRWVLQSNAYDTTRIRNGICYSLAQDLGLNHAVDYRYVDVYFNGEYAGNYMIVEAIDIEENRLDLSAEKGDFLAEVYGKGIIDSDAGITYRIKYPKDLSEAQVEAVKKQINDIENMIIDCDSEEKYEKLKNYIDVNSFAAMYLLDGLTNETDSNAASTYYYYLAEEGKLYAGPMWDCDMSLGRDTAVKHVADEINAYFCGYPEFLANSDFFMDDVRAVLEVHPEAVGNMRQNAELLSDKMQMSLEMDRIRYKEMIGRLAGEFGSFEQTRDYLLERIDSRNDLFLSTIYHPEMYCKVIAIDERGRGWIIWIRKNEEMSENIRNTVLNLYDWGRLEFVDGNELPEDYIFTQDMIISGE